MYCVLDVLLCISFNILYNKYLVLFCENNHRFFIEKSIYFVLLHHKILEGSVA